MGASAHDQRLGTGLQDLVCQPNRWRHQGATAGARCKSGLGRQLLIQRNQASEEGQMGEDKAWVWWQLSWLRA